MPWALFTAGFIFLLLTLHSHRPLRRPGTFVIGTWLASWLVIELPLHHIAAQAAAAVLLAGAGGLTALPGFVGLGLVTLSCVGLARHVSLARRTADIVNAALTEALGDDYLASIHRGHRLKLRDGIDWFRVARVFPIRRRDVERVPNLVYHTEGDRELRLDVYRHRARPSGCPVLMYVHGGGWVIGNKNQQGLVTVNHMASRGWLCVSIDYRLSPRATFPDHLLDVKRAIRWVRENAEEYGGDPSFVMLAGGSAGAHLAALAALTPNAPEYQRDFPSVDTSVDGCIAYYGVYDFLDRHGHWPHGMFRLMLERTVMKRRLDDDRRAYEQASPIDQLRSDAPPFMILHGDRDVLAPVQEARRFVAAFRERASAPIAYAELPGAQHAFELFPSVRSLHVMNGVERFCAGVYSRQRAASERDVG